MAQNDNKRHLKMLKISEIAKEHAQKLLFFAFFCVFLHLFDFFFSIFDLPQKLILTKFKGAQRKCFKNLWFDPPCHFDFTNIKNYKNYNKKNKKPAFLPVLIDFLVNFA